MIAEIVSIVRTFPNHRSTKKPDVLAILPPLNEVLDLVIDEELTTHQELRMALDDSISINAEIRVEPLTAFMHPVFTVERGGNKEDLRDLHQALHAFRSTRKDFEISASSSCGLLEICPH